MNKICKKCNLEKDILDFRHQARGDKTYISKTCKKCDFENNKEVHKKFRENNREKLKQINRDYYSTNKKEIKERQKYKKPQWDKKYYLNNKIKIQKTQQDRVKIRYNTDPNFRIRKCISKSISRHLSKNNSSKNSKSCLNYMSYSMDELKKHLESLFESWMTWNNYGIYVASIWDDNDSSTWTWQIDHIIPHSTFKYNSMDDEEFKKCWSLDNLRPYSSKQNNMDGVSKSRHFRRL